jgi:hypothetical protein
MNNSTPEFQEAARQYYEACFGTESDHFTNYQAILAAEAACDFDLVDELRETEAESVLSVEQLTHSFRGNCEWEILLTTGGPAARVVVEVDVNGEVKWANFEYQDWYQPWIAPTGQDRKLLIDWVAVVFLLECRYCQEENCR